MLKVRPEDLIRKVIEADDLRRRARGQTSTRAALDLEHGGTSRERRWIEPWFNLLGMLWAQGMFLMPWSLRKPYVQWILQKMASHGPEDNPVLQPRAAETTVLAGQIKARTGQWPALLIVTSHPDTEGPLEWLRFEVLRQGMQIADTYVEARWPGNLFRPHPKLFLAIDPYALDTLSTPAGGFYGAWMHRIYLAWDRQISTQSWIQKHLFLRGTGYDRIAWRLFRTLRSDIPVLMAVGGGLPFNARLLYGAREFIQGLRFGIWKVTKREAQKEILEILMNPEDGKWSGETGEISPAQAEKIRQAMLRWGILGELVPEALRQLREALKPAVPLRERLFRALQGRCAGQGKPLLVVALAHQTQAPHIRISEPFELIEAAETARRLQAFFEQKTP